VDLIELRSEGAGPCWPRQARWAVVAAVLAVGLGGCAARRGLPVGAARELFSRNELTVVTVRAVLKVRMGERDNEQKLDVTGTVIDPSGLTVLPASALDPGASMRALLRGRPGDFKLSTSVTETVLVLADGTELEADVILKDEELDLAFLRPRNVPFPLEAVDLRLGSARMPQLLDDVVLIGRYGRSLNRTPWLDVTRVLAIVKGPRPYAICGDNSADALGTVAWAADGTPLGVFVTHIGRDVGGESPRMRAGGSVILRAVEDVLEVAEQARKLKNPEHRAEPNFEGPAPAPGPVPGPTPLPDNEQKAKATKTGSRT
jgi:hypothetical protein